MKKCTSWRLYSLAWHFAISFLSFYPRILFGQALYSFKPSFWASGRFSAGVNRGCFVVDFVLQLLVAKKRNAAGGWLSGRFSGGECIFAFVQLSLSKRSHQQKTAEKTAHQRRHASSSPQSTTRNTLKARPKDKCTLSLSSNSLFLTLSHKQSNKGAGDGVCYFFFLTTHGKEMEI